MVSGGATENLVLNANDVIPAGNGLAGLIKLAIDGGAGNDTITGSDGNDRCWAAMPMTSSAAATATTQPCSAPATTPSSGTRATAAMSSRARTAPIRCVFKGANIAETISIAASGGRVRLTRDVAAVAMDLTGVEPIQLNTLGGADKITVNNLAGTDAKQVTVTGLSAQVRTAR